MPTGKKREAERTEAAQAPESSVSETSVPEREIPVVTAAAPTESESAEPADASASAETDTGTTEKEDPTHIPPTASVPKTEAQVAAASEETAERTAPQASSVVNINPESKKFHRPDCTDVKSMKDENKWEYTGTREELIAMGYQPCKTCKP